MDVTVYGFRITPFRKIQLEYATVGNWNFETATAGNSKTILKTRR